VLRVVLSGVESVGKSLLAERLAARFGGACVPEYGRDYTERLDRPLAPHDLREIAAGHQLAAARAAAGAPPLLVEDTDIVMTTAWGTMLFGGRNPALAALSSAADLHLLLLPDVPFVPDPVRLFGDPDRRAALHAIVEAEFAARGLRPERIGGSFPERTEAAIAHVAERMG
jgi:nicotinamide riboside kinase